MKKIAVIMLAGFPLFSGALHSQSVLLSWDIPTTASPNSVTTPTSVTSSYNDASLLPSTITMGPGIISSITNSGRFIPVHWIF